jgi:hypothetical protein
MRLSIIHETKYCYATLADYTIQYLWLSPQTSLQQKVLSWSLDLPRPAVHCRMRRSIASHKPFVAKP